MSAAPAPELSFLIARLQLWLLFVFTHLIFSFVGVPQVEWKMYISSYMKSQCTKLKESTRLIGG